MTWVQHALADYGRQLGFSALSLNERGVAQIELQSGRVLAIELIPRGTEEDVLVYLISSLGYEGATIKLKALQRAHYRQAASLPIQLACLGDGPEEQLIVLTRMGSRHCTPQALGQAFDSLRAWMDDL